MLLELLNIFYTSFIQSILTIPVTCRSPSATKLNRNRLPRMAGLQRKMDLQLLLRPLTVFNQEQKHTLNFKKKKNVIATLGQYWLLRSSDTKEPDPQTRLCHLNSHANPILTSVDYLYHWSWQYTHFSHIPAWNIGQRQATKTGSSWECGAAIKRQDWAETAAIYLHADFNHLSKLLKSFITCVWLHGVWGSHLRESHFVLIFKRKSWTLHLFSV